MSDRQFGDRTIPPMDRGYVARSDRPYVGGSLKAAMCGVLAFIAVLLIGGMIYFSGRSDVATNPQTPSTTGAAPQTDQRPAPPVPPAPPGLRVTAIPSRTA